METKPTNIFYTQQFLTIAGIFYVTSLSPAVDRWIDGTLTPKETKQLANAALVSIIGGFLKLNDPKVYTPGKLPGRNRENATANIIAAATNQLPVITSTVQKVDNTVQDVSVAVQSLNPVSAITDSITGKNPFDAINHASESIGHLFGVPVQPTQSVIPPLQIKAITTTKYKQQPVDASTLLPTQYRTVEKNALEGMKLYSPVVNNHVEFVGYDDCRWYAFAPHVVLVENNTETHFISMAVKYPTQDQLSQVYGNTVTNTQYTDFIKCCDTFGITTHEDICQFVAQTAHESGGLQYTTEIATGDDYEGREDLGNTEPGDGRLYKGSGFIQLTGRRNFQEFSDYLGDLRVMEGCDYVASNYPFTSAGFFWFNNRISEEIANGADIVQVTRIVNGGTNGLDERIAYYNKAKEVLV